MKTAPSPDDRFVVKNDLYGYYCGHRCGARASWKPKFKVKFTQKKEEATRMTERGGLNCGTNLYLMGHGFFFKVEEITENAG